MSDISAAVRQQAAEWLVDLQGPDAGPGMREAWQRWLEADPDHARAWCKIEALAGKTGMLPAGVARAALLPARPSRRRVLRVAALGAMGSGAWFIAGRVADPARQDTAAGERHDLRLADGTRLLLNTRTRVRVRFDASQRLLVLDRGEILVETAPDPQQPARAFRVRTAAGDMQAVGTRFTVRHDEATRLHVLEGAVDVRRAGDPGGAVRVHAGHRLQFDAAQLGDTVRAADSEAAWTRGMLLAVDMPLADFVSELARYRPGVLDCDPALSALRVSGTFPLDDTDRVLAMLQDVLPVSVRRWTPYWVRLQPRAQAAARPL